MDQQEIVGSLDGAIQKMAQQASAAGNDQEKAIRFSQAAYNLAQTKQIMMHLGQNPGPPKKARAST